MISENERHYANMVLDVIDNVECPMLMYEGEKAIVRKALKAYIENNGTADTPQTDKDKVVCPNCGRSDYIRSFEKDFGIKNSEYRYKCINCNTYIKDTPQTDLSAEEFVEGMKNLKMEAKQTDIVFYDYEPNTDDVRHLGWSGGIKTDCGWK